MAVRPANSPEQAPIRVIRRGRPLDNPHFRFEPPADPATAG